MPKSGPILFVVLVLWVTAAGPGQGAAVVGKPKAARGVQAAATKPEPQGATLGKWIVSGVNTLRHESWKTLQSANSTRDRNYHLLADRLALTLKHQQPWTTFTATVNAVKFLNLPDDTSFGSASTYTANDNREGDTKVYFRTLNLSFKRIGDQGMSGTIGRFDYSNGTEWKGRNPTIEWVKGNRVSDRLFGLPTWTMFQRSMNGVILKRDNGRFHGAASAWMPTAGTYSKQAGDIINDVKVLTLAGTFKFDTVIPHQEIQVFGYNYDDNRPIVAPRADNVVTGAPQQQKASTDGIDVSVRTYGVSAAGAYDLPGGILDTMIWLAWQTGDWYELTHRANAFAIEAGYQWSKAAWKPWLRFGLNQSSGDSDPNDGTHGTFFVMLPSRKHSNCNAYNQMNLRDFLVQLMARPSTRTQLCLDYHRLRLKEGADRWYSGGGAMANTGTVNGFTARKTGGRSDLGSVVDFTASYALEKRVRLNLFVSRFKGGDAVENTYAAVRNQSFSYLELVTEF